MQLENCARGSARLIFSHVRVTFSGLSTRQKRICFCIGILTAAEGTESAPQILGEEGVPDSTKALLIPARPLIPVNFQNKFLAAPLATDALAR